MAITQDDFKKVWASTSSVPKYTFSDTDYKNGWEFVGNLPPTRAMWDTLQRRNDQKMKYLQDNGSMCFDSVTDMKSSNLDAGQTAFTKGYYSINDGGRATYIIRTKKQTDVEDERNIIFLENGNVAERINKSTVRFLFPANKSTSNWDCELIVTDSSVLMIDSGVDDEEIRQYLIDFMVEHGIKKVDYFLLSHYHSDHDGNIIPFLNQSVVDFSYTKWFLPNVDLSFESHKTEIIAALEAAGADYEVLLDDKTINISHDVTMEIMGANPDYIQYLDSVMTTQNLNVYSLCALIQHNNVKAFYTGDIGYPSTKGLMDFYKLSKVNIVKCPHHGLNTSYDTAYDSQFFSVLSTDYLTTNVNHYEFLRRVSEEAPFSSDKRMYTQYAYANGAKILPLRFGDVSFISDGTSVAVKQMSKSVSTFFNETQMHLYVDSSYTESDCDGSAERPYPDLNILIDSLAEKQFSNPIAVTITAGTYPSLILTNFPSEIVFATTGGAVNIGNLHIKNCPAISFSGTYSLKAIQVFKSNVDFYNGTVTITPDETYTHIYDNIISLQPPQIYSSANTPIIFADSLIHFVALTINGANIPDSYNLDALGHILKSIVNIRNFIIRGVTKTRYHVLQVQYGSILTIVALDIDTTTKVAFRLQFCPMVLIDSITLGASFSAALCQYNGGFFNYNTAIKRGTRAQRPAIKTVPDGFTYLDTEVGCLLVKHGNYWYKATDGTTA